MQVCAYLSAWRSQSASVLYASPYQQFDKYHFASCVRTVRQQQIYIYKCRYSLQTLIPTFLCSFTTTAAPKILSQPPPPSPYRPPHSQHIHRTCPRLAPHRQSTLMRPPKPRRLYYAPLATDPIAIPLANNSLPVKPPKSIPVSWFACPFEHSHRLERSPFECARRG